MIALLALALSGAFVPPPEGGEAFYGGIWNDLGSNALIGHGNVVAVDWYWAADRAAEEAGEQGPRMMHIADLACRKPGGKQRQCRFTLVRDGGPVRLGATMVADRLACSARFERGVDDNWYVVRKPPQGYGHTITTMRCRVAKG
ncbi:hypothetical protein CFHF_14900 [Caulobacter flavus]|uniref:Uncharacterized protein n=1 Tax=Caulobacter flavus TaxID=1679497 RepID=A0A2N5CRX0_9CAUL|nr:hypothetical protein [Caulobacter flavus]AYV46427.1 hypothetical protein C1707_09215 [Caulobacter flavus]PLR12724.1 hypothetical protein CFHF_14900 [Caulobacter flavus]